MTITTVDEVKVHGTRKESDSLGVVEVPVDKL
jgi:hypothetical protein